MTFDDIKTGELFYIQRPIKGNPLPTLWRKKSTRTAELASGYSPIINRPRWFYFSKLWQVYKA
jgi:hypothetical protein